MDFPTSYRWSAYTLLQSIPKGWLKSDSFVFLLLNKIQFQSSEVCYKLVSLYENFQRQSCSITIPPSNGPARNVTRQHKI